MWDWQRRRRNKEGDGGESKEAMQNLQRICTKRNARRSNAKFVDNVQWIYTNRRQWIARMLYPSKKKNSFYFATNVQSFR
jgi:hypothetical protein